MRILILDYSTDRSQSAHYRRWLRLDVPVTTAYVDTEASFPSGLIDEGFTHVIHSGSLLSITEPAPFTERAVSCIRELRNRQVPQMGVCYGHQLVNFALLGKFSVRRSPNGFEAGWCNVALLDDTFGIPGAPKEIRILQHHFDEVVELPTGSRILATNRHTKIQAFINTELRLFGTQFHPEFARETGNQYFEQDRKRLEDNLYNVDELKALGPSVDAGPLFFGFFLSFFKAP